ncbi:uncharacterized protein HMPREF1541_05077 [Cyphellophora europaea CBS 101466]|uniref:Uncharacterized protein n=1 Tax=Cyphellophora europaea (strain CBS 101466) TaxID=1220924 RepID=W2RWI0_CYPE1|nr:uncharacterized protein HMPREF1541_05077 [Cyphellophora europaea CBS 101466]ETN40797.1 hypothetical protein HMPREF1541_05077 [Cyphellophora europaea CBS 101466]
MLFRPNFEKRFLACKDRIEWHTGHVKLQVNTAGFEDSKKRDDSMMALLTKNISSQQSMVKITFPFRFVQNVPRNDNFFGRGNALCDIEQHLDPGPRRGVPRMRSLVIHGLGGCGKSSVAKEYMYREYRAGKYEVIIWLYADSKDKLETQFIGLARALGIQVSEPESRHAVLNWINNFDREFLFVFDNADDPGFLKPYWPNTVRGSVLVTSRNLKVQNEGLAFVGLPLRAFGDQDGIDFLRQGLPSGFQADEDDIKALEQLTQRFGGLPLALRTAASFMTNKNCSPVKFLRLYDQRSEVIDSYQVEGYSRTVATTWTVSTSALSEASLVLLDAFSLLDPDSIPAELFDSTETHHAFAMFLDDPLAVANAQEGLTQQSLVDYDHSSRSMSVHRHLQHITLSRLVKNKTRFRQVTDLSLHLLSAYIPEFGFTSVRHPQNWKYVEHSLSHIQSVYGKCKDALTESASQKLLVCLTKSIWYVKKFSKKLCLGRLLIEEAMRMNQANMCSEYGPTRQR